jgi:hypothetical protein
METVLARYHFKPDREQEFRSLLKSHWPTLHKLGFTTDKKPLIYRGREQRGDAEFYLEIFEWKDGAYRQAHKHPDVVAIWEPMEQCCNRTEFPHAEAVKL